MSTIPSASPRPSLTISSRRTSTSTDATATASTTTTERTTARRNKAAALRDYYGLSTAAPSTPTRQSLELPNLLEKQSELDHPSFDPETYVTNLLRKGTLQEVLRAEANLLSEIRSLDGEKKALVYDNYSKLIAATETIRSMREKMEPMNPATSTLVPAVGEIAETAAALSREMGRSSLGRDGERKQKEVGTVRWVLGAPERIRLLQSGGDADGAHEQWAQIQGVLQSWSTRGVKGASEVRQQCLAILDDTTELTGG